jgi:hypothetical protein
MRKTSRLMLLICSLILLSACGSMSRIAPKSDCLPDVPCVPCIFPFPVYPVESGNNQLNACQIQNGLLPESSNMYDRVVER